MKKLLLLILISGSLYAIPAKRTPTLITQPDGSKFSLIGFGDERYSFAETLDGYVIIQGKDNYWYYATLNSEGQFVSSEIIVRENIGANQVQFNLNIQKHLRESQNIISSKMSTYLGDQSTPAKTFDKSNISRQKIQAANSTSRRELILCVKYPDLANTYTSQSFQDMINNDSWKDGIGGLNKYFKEASYNNLTVQADYQDWITAANPYIYYAKSDPNYTTHVKELVRQCIDAAEANGVDFRVYDNDGDGVVDGVFIIHAGPGAEEGSNNNYIWSHKGSLSSTPTYDGKTFNYYIALPEKYNSGHVDIGVICHEYGHMIGLPDTYDTDGATNGNSEGLGNWCLMAGGAWGGNGSTPDRPVHMSAFCKSLLGYTTPTLVSSTQMLTIPDAETNSVSYKIWMDTNQSDEYMLIENRQKTGFDLNLPGSGLLIYHIDKNLAEIYPASNDINITNTHLGIKLYEADGLEQLATDINRGSAGDPYPGSTNNNSLTAATTPNSKLWDNSSSGVEISSISSSSSSMTAIATVPGYYGYNQQFYRKAGSSGYLNSYQYGMVKCTPSRTGKLLGIRVYSNAGMYSVLNATAFTGFSSNTLSGQTGNSVTTASGSLDNFIQMNFSPSINVTQNVPIYIRILFQTSTGYFLPVDGTATITGNSYRSSSSDVNGTLFTQLTNYDLPVRVVFQSDSMLPVELTSFIAMAENESVILNWNTATEINNYGFEIERSIGNENWQKIGFLSGHGNSNSPKQYSYVDKNPPCGKLNYRLKQIDFDGSYEYSSEVEVIVDSPVKFVLNQNHPNPFNPETIISYQIPEAGFVTLKIFDILGKEVTTLVNEYKPAGFYNSTFSIMNYSLSSGLYFYRIQAGSYSAVRKMILLK